MSDNAQQKIHLGRPTEFLLILLCFAGIGRLPEPVRSYVAIALMLYLPLLVGRYRPRFLASDKGQLRLWAGLSTGILFAFVLVMVGWFTWKGHVWHTPGWQKLGGYALNTLIAAAIPEEWFFRGFLLERWHKSGQATRWWLPSRDNLLVATVFGLVHVAMDLNPARFVVFFPALWYGAMVERGAGLGVSMLFHALSNLLMFWMLSGFGA